MQSRKRIVRSFTLIEILIVVGIVGILSMIALPNFLEAQNRAKIAKAKSHIKVLVDANQIYRVDWNKYPPMAPQIPEDPYGILVDVQLAVLTTPIAYISSSPFKDPFGEIKKALVSVPVPECPNPRTSLLYYNYHYFSQWTRNPFIDVIGIALVSIGPDRRDSFGVFRPFSEAALPPLARAAGIRHPLDTEYDPTNGTRSGGDLFGFAGDMPVPQ